MDPFDIVLKASRPGALAILVRLFSDIDLAEEAVQEAMLRALVVWRDQTVPENPIAWLVQTGRRFAIDVLRRRDLEKRYKQNETFVFSNDHIDQDNENTSTLQLHDDQLKLIFTCCHPALAIDAQVALSLKTIVGMSIDEIARAYLVSTKTMEQRLTRAKRKIRDAGIAFEIPRDSEIESRLAGVMGTIYLIYNQAYTVYRGADLLDSQLSEAAIYLAHMLNRLVRGNLEAQGLLALILLQHSRAAARIDSNGLPVPLEEQNRHLWDRRYLARGMMFVEKFRHSNVLGYYQIQASIAAVHCRAQKPVDTDWREIVLLYELLESISPSPVVTLNRAIAVARLHGPEQGLSLLNNIEKNTKMINFQYFHSARAGLLSELGNKPASVAAFKIALELCENDAEKRYLAMKLDELLNDKLSLTL